jgi:hypothetical protein
VFFAVFSSIIIVLAFVSYLGSKYFRDACVMVHSFTKMKPVAMVISATGPCSNEPEIM